MMNRVIPSAGTVRSYQMDEAYRWFIFNTFLKGGRQNTGTARYGAAHATMEKMVIELR